MFDFLNENLLKFHILCLSQLQFEERAIELATERSSLLNTFEIDKRNMDKERIQHKSFVRKLEMEHDVLVTDLKQRVLELEEDYDALKADQLEYQERATLAEALQRKESQQKRNLTRQLEKEKAETRLLR